MRQHIFNINLAWQALKANPLRTGLTIAIIALGITVLVGILTATEVMKSGVTNNFSQMGANSFQISNTSITTSNKAKVKKYDPQRPIEWDDAKSFKEKFSDRSTVGITCVAQQTAVAQFGSQETNPNIMVMGTDLEYLQIANITLSEGRLYNDYELFAGAPVCVIGNGIKNKLFNGKAENGINRVINVGNKKFRVIGVAKPNGGSMMNNMDNQIYVPIQTARSQYGSKRFVIHVMVSNVLNKDFLTEEAEGLFRQIRKIPVGYENNFTIRQNDSIAKMLLENLKYVSWAAIIVAIVTLVGSIIGLMNIMLVSVSERTREIGIAKALGAKPNTIRDQFLTESILISILGGLSGIFFGILLGNILGIALDITFVVPWLWILMSLVLCSIVGILSGVIPANKASRLHPINALRHE